MRLTVIKGVIPIDSPTEEKEKYQEDLLARYKSLMPLKFAKGTIPTFNTALNNYLPWLNDNSLFIWEVNPNHFDSFSEHLANNVSKATMVNYLTHISNFYDWIVSRCRQEIVNKYGITSVNPIDKWNTPSRRSEEDELPELPDGEVVNYYFQKEKQEFADALGKGDRRKLLILARQLTAEQIMLKAGLRVEEVCNLDVRDIDLVQMLITVHKGKGDKDRIVDINDSLAPILKWYIEQGHPLKQKGKKLDNKIPLFISEQKSRISKKTIQHRLWDQQEKYNIPIDQRFSPHGLRRLFATNLYIDLINEKHPDPLIYIKSQLGHVFYSTTLRYCRIPNAIIARASNKANATIKRELLDGGEGNL